MLVTINSNDPAFKVAWLDDVTQNGYLQQLQRYFS